MMLYLSVLYAYVHNFHLYVCMYVYRTVSFTEFIFFMWKAENSAAMYLTSNEYRAEK